MEKKRGLESSRLLELAPSSNGVADCSQLNTAQSTFPHLGCWIKIKNWIQKIIISKCRRIPVGLF